MNRAWSRRGVLAGLTFCLGLHLCGPPLAADGGRGRSAPGSQQPAQLPVFRSGTTLIQVDVIVRRGDGTVVQDLALQDFEVLEDGTPRQADFVYLVVDTQPRVVPVAAESPTVTSSDTRLPPAAQRVFVLVLDSAHMTLARFQRAKAGAEAFLQREVSDGDLIGIMNGGELVNDRLSSGRDEALTALRSVSGSAQAESFSRELQDWPRMTEFEASKIVEERGASQQPVTDAVVAAACNEQPDACASFGNQVLAAADGKARRVASHAGEAVRAVLDRLTALCEGLSRLPGRKTVVLLSDGFIVDQELGALGKLEGEAARAGVVMYTLDTRGLDRGTAGSDVLLEAARYDRTVRQMRQLAVTAAQDTLNSLAVDTGGLAIRSENDFPKALHEIAEDGRIYYVLGYRPASVGVEGQFHALTVRVKRPGVTVRARKGYLATSPAPPTAAPGGLQTTGGDRDVVAQAGRPSTGGSTLPSRALEPQPLALPSAPAWMDLNPRTVDLTAIRLRPRTEDKAALGSLRETTTGGGREVSRPVSDPLATTIAQGWEAYQRGDTQTARAVLSSIAGHTAAPPWAHYVLGWADFAEGEFAAAASAWEHVAQAVPDYEPTYFNLADAYLHLHEGAHALATVRLAAARWPGDLDLLNALGVIQISMGALDDAIATFDRGLVLNPSDPVTHFNSATASEVQYVRAVQRGQPPHDADRQRAIASYRRVVAAGGDLAAQAGDALRRLEPLEASRLEFSKPISVVRLSESQLGGQPFRLAWAPDGSAVCVDSVVWGEGLTFDEAIKEESFRLVSMPDGPLTTTTTPPAWAGLYWSWKSALGAPWLPTVRISMAIEQPSIGLGMGVEKRSGTVRSMDGSRGRWQVYRLHGEIVGQATSKAFVPGSSFGWSPFAMGALAYVDVRGTLTVMDTKGRRRDVGGWHDAWLPAWSPDGRRLAFLVSDRGWRLVVVEVRQRGGS